jgi:hypothetical protein
MAEAKSSTPVHDRGGRPGAGPIDQTEHQLDDWEYLAEGISGALAAKGIRCTDESRRAMESLPPDVYESLKYYERWAAGAEIILIEKGLLTREEIDAKMAELEPRWT